MKTHLIEWKRLVKQGRTCTRCNDTGGTLRDILRDLKPPRARRPLGR